jgi:uncharacterized membrane protein YdcZ (DUF606 family)
MQLSRLRTLYIRFIQLRVRIAIVVGGPLAMFLLVFVGVYHVKRYTIATTDGERATRAVLVALATSGILVDVWGWFRFRKSDEFVPKLVGAIAVAAAIVLAEIMLWSAW